MWIIVAPSCVGKSTFIKSKAAFRMTKLKPTLRLTAHSYMRGKRFEDSYYMEFCARSNPTLLYQKCQSSTLTRRAVVLAIPKLTHLRRIKLRIKEFENVDTQVPLRRYLNAIRKFSPSAYLNKYKVTFKHLQNHKIPYTILRADKLGYPEISEEDLPRLFEEISKEEIQATVSQFPRERYGRVNLPFGLHTKGVDRSPTRNAIMPKSLKGKSLLDVGSAFGYWCFEAEDLGAASVLGLEIKSGRLKRANLFRNLRKSKVVTFRNENITKLDLKGEFDYILVLNVLHHLPNALKVLDFLGEKAKEKLVVESPVKFRKVDLMKVIEDSFENVEFMPSALTSMRGEERRIAICSF